MLFCSQLYQQVLPLNPLTPYVTSQPMLVPFYQTLTPGNHPKACFRLFMYSGQHTLKWVFIKKNVNVAANLNAYIRVITLAGAATDDGVRWTVDKSFINHSDHAQCMRSMSRGLIFSGSWCRILPVMPLVYSQLGSRASEVRLRSFCIAFIFRVI